MHTHRSPNENHVLAALAPADLSRLAASLALVRLARGDVLYQAGGKMLYAYFPVTATISIDYVLGNGDTSEIASIGNEGVLDVSLLMGSVTAPARAVVQLPGYAYRLSATHLIAEICRKGPLLPLLLRYAQARLIWTSLLAVCNSHHSTQQRLCRFLLQTLDRTSSDELPFTQEAIAAILGVRREGITAAVGRLQQLNIIKWRRGHVLILDRTKLAARSCECYEAARQAARTLLLEPSSSAWQDSVDDAPRSLGTVRRRMSDSAGQAAHDAAQAALNFFP